MRAVADIGTHWLDLLQFITGLRVQAVLADLKTVHPVRRRPRGEVETLQAQACRAQDGARPSGRAGIDRHRGLRQRPACAFAGGAVGSLWVSQVTAGRKNCLRYEISGARGSLAWNSETPNELWVGHRDRANELLLKDPACSAPRRAYYASYPGGHNEGYPDSFKQCFRAFYEHIAGRSQAGGVPYPTFADGHREIVLCEAILASHRQARWVQVSG